MMFDLPRNPDLPQLEAPAPSLTTPDQPVTSQHLPDICAPPERGRDPVLHAADGAIGAAANSKEVSLDTAGGPRDQPDAKTHEGTHAEQDDAPSPVDAGQDPPIIDPPDGSRLASPDGDDEGDDGSRPPADDTGEGAQSVPEPTSNRAEVQQRVVTDPELAEKLTSAGDAAGMDNVDRILEANAPFVRPGQLYGEDGSPYIDEQHHNKTVLDEVPPLVEAANKAQIPVDQAADLAAHALGTIEYPQLTHPYQVIARVTKALDCAANPGEAAPDNAVAELKELVSTAGDKGVTMTALSSFAAARRTGLSAEDSTALVKEFIDTGNHRQVPYTMREFRTALEAINIAGLDPAATKSVFGAIAGVDPEERSEAYSMFREAITDGCPGLDLTPTELVNSITTQLDNGVEVREAIRRATGMSGQLRVEVQDPSPPIIAPREVIERRFTEKPGPLEFAALSYQTERPLNEGVRDLEGLTDADSRRGDIAGEGAWVHDPDNGKWYSLGGETKFLGGGHVNHRHVAFDVSQLSSKPYLFHIHPTDAAMHSDRYGYTFPTGADYTAVANMLDIAAQPAELRSFISHPLGITEFTFPTDNTEAIREVAATFEGLRDELWHSITPDERDIPGIARQMGEREFMTRCVQAINQHLPPGFAIRWHERGVDLEEIVRRQR
jgi:hypothetical protein